MKMSTFTSLPAHLEKHQPQQVRAKGLSIPVRQRRSNCFWEDERSGHCARWSNLLVLVLVGLITSKWVLFKHSATQLRMIEVRRCWSVRASDTCARIWWSSVRDVWVRLTTSFWHNARHHMSLTQMQYQTNSQERCAGSYDVSEGVMCKPEGCHLRWHIPLFVQRENGILACKEERHISGNDHYPPHEEACRDCCDHFSKLCPPCLCAKIWSSSVMDDWKRSTTSFWHNARHQMSLSQM